MHDEKSETARPDVLQIALELQVDELHKLDEILFLYKSIKGQSLNKSEFLELAVLEKARRDMKKPLTDIFNKRRINLKISREISDEADKLIQRLKMAGSKVSKSEWIAQALREKIELDEAETFKNLEESFPFDADLLTSAP